jgi:hypothetical protein
VPRLDAACDSRAGTSEPSNIARRTGPALEAMYQLLLWLVPAVDKFPRNQKFVLGDRIDRVANFAVCDVFSCS